MYASSRSVPPSPRRATLSATMSPDASCRGYSASPCIGLNVRHRSRSGLSNPYRRCRAGTPYHSVATSHEANSARHRATFTLSIRAAPKIASIRRAASRSPAPSAR